MTKVSTKLIYLDWNVFISLAEQKLDKLEHFLVQARDAVAPRIRIGVAPDGMAGQISWTSENPNWENSWTRTWGEETALTTGWTVSDNVTSTSTLLALVNIHVSLQEIP